MKTMTILKRIAKLEELERAKMNVWGDEKKAIELKQENIKAGVRRVVKEMFSELTEKVEDKNNHYENDYYIHTVYEMLNNHKNGIIFIRNSGVDYFYCKSVHQTTMFKYYLSQVRHDHKEVRNIFTNEVEQKAKATNRTRESDRIHMYKLENGVPVKRLSLDAVLKEFEMLPTIEEMNKINKELVTA